MSRAISHRHQLGGHRFSRSNQCHSTSRCRWRSRWERRLRGRVIEERARDGRRVQLVPLRLCDSRPERVCSLELCSPARRLDGSRPRNRAWRTILSGKSDDVSNAIAPFTDAAVTTTIADADAAVSAAAPPLPSLRPCRSDAGSWLLPCPLSGTAAASPASGFGRTSGVLLFGAAMGIRGRRWGQPEAHFHVFVCVYVL